jgi:hypothetical protein
MALAWSWTTGSCVATTKAISSATILDCAVPDGSRARVSWVRFDSQSSAEWVLSSRSKTCFRHVTSPELEQLGETATSIWGKLVAPEGRLIGVSTEQLFGSDSAERFPAIKPWVGFVRARYAWIWT